MSSRPITSCKRYAVSYRDLANKRHELGFYAIDAFEARQLAIEFNKFVREHPNSIDRISLRNKYLMKISAKKCKITNFLEILH